MNKPVDTSGGKPSSWQPIGERSAEEAGQRRGDRPGYAVRAERAPWFRWVLSIALLGLIAAGAIWLAREVVVPRDAAPVGPRVDIDPNAKPPRTADDEAWVRALEKDTLEGYREYLEEFPNGRYAEQAQAEIDSYDNKAWATAEQRNTIAGYEDYLAAWPEGLNASKARERINELRAEEEARQRDAAERARREAADWQEAAATNTVASYQDYLRKQPSGRNAGEAQARIDRLQASAADQAAWDAARAANRADAYERYLESFPQGAYAADAIAAIENLRPAPGRTLSDCAECPTLVSLAAGTDILGASGPDARPNEGPARSVNFASMFAVATTETTFAQWDACVAGGGCREVSDNGWGRGNRPVINVTWEDANGYAQWLSSKTGKSYALPTEAQWEYAARAGLDTPAIADPKSLCAFANGAGSESGLAWANSACTDPAADRTLPVGTLSANAFKVRDIIGNVAEWTLDCNTLNLRDAPVDGSADSRGSCAQRATRGGSWFSAPGDLRFGARLMQRRGDSNDFTGFRVVRKLDG